MAVTLRHPPARGEGVGAQLTTSGWGQIGWTGKGTTIHRLGKPESAENNDVQTASAAPTVWSPSCNLDSPVLVLAVSLSPNHSGSFLQKDPISICSLLFLDAPTCSDNVWGGVHLLCSHQGSCSNNRLPDTGGGTLEAPWGTKPESASLFGAGFYSPSLLPGPGPLLCQKADCLPACAVHRPG